MFVLKPMETMGGWHDATVQQVKKIASAQARHTEGEQSDVTRHIYQRMAVLLVCDIIITQIEMMPSPE